MKIQNWKKQEVEEIKQLLEEYPVIGIVDGTSLPSMQLQKIRFKLKPDFLIRMTKARLLKLAIEQVKTKKPGIEKLESYIRYKIPLLIFSRKDSFKLSSLLIKNRSSAAAKPGQIALNDIVIPAGPTEFTPGPIIGELGQAGLKTAVEGGKIAIKEDKLVVKEGQVINDKVATVLSKLGILPMKIGINLVATYDNGSVFEKSVLNIDEETYINNIKLATMNAFNLAFNIGYPTKENIKLMIMKAELEEKAIESKIDMEKINSLNVVHEVKEQPKHEVKHEVVEHKKVEPVVEHKHEEIKHVKEPEHEVKHEVIEHKPEIKHEQPKESHAESQKSNIPDKFDEYSQKAQDILKNLQDKKLKKRL